jgi:hypothetical protein
MTPAPVPQTGKVLNDREASSGITLVQDSLAENDEKHRRAYGCACIAPGKGLWRELKAEEKQATESGQRHSEEKTLRGQRPETAVKKDTGLPLC